MKLKSNQKYKFRATGMTIEHYRQHTIQKQCIKNGVHFHCSNLLIQHKCRKDGCCLFPKYIKYSTHGETLAKSTFQLEEVFDSITYDACYLFTSTAHLMPTSYLCHSHQTNLYPISKWMRCYGEYLCAGQSFFCVSNVLTLLFYPKLKLFKCSALHACM